MKRAIALLVAGGCGGPQAPVPAKPCPAHDDLAKLLAQPVELELRIVERFNWAASCAAIPQHVVRVRVDNQPWCETTIQCDKALRAPPRSFACAGKPIAAGARTLGVELDDQPESLMQITVSLPAFDYAQDGSVFLGAHVKVRVDEQTIRIDPPTVLPQKMM
jgi:hypothetical protein